MAFNPRLVRFQNILQRGSERKPRASIGVCHLEQTWRVGLDHLRAVEASWGIREGLGAGRERAGSGIEVTSQEGRVFTSRKHRSFWNRQMRVAGLPLTCSTTSWDLRNLHEPQLPFLKIDRAESYSSAIGSLKMACGKVYQTGCSVVIRTIVYFEGLFGGLKGAKTVSWDVVDTQ